MDEKFTINLDANDELTPNPEETEYVDLIIRLKEIRSTIALLDKKYLEKF